MDESKQGTWEDTILPTSPRQGKGVLTLYIVLAALVAGYAYVLRGQFQAEWQAWGLIAAVVAMATIGIYGRYCEIRDAQAFHEHHLEHTLRERELVEAVRASEKRYRALIESSYDGIVLLDMGGKIVTCNPTASRALQPGMYENLAGRPLAPFFPEQCQTDILVALERVLQGDVAVIKTYTYTSTGASRWWECMFVPLEENQGQQANILVTARDITDKKRAEEKLQDTRRYLSSLIDSSVDAIISTNKEGNVVTFSKGAEAMLGYGQHDIIGRYVAMLFENEDRAKDVMRKMRDNKGSVSAYETVLRTKEGDTIPVLISASLLYDEEGGEIGTVGFNKDLRERKRAERALAERSEELARSNAELQEFARVASHDLQEPLRKVKAFGNRLKDKCEDALTEEGNEYLERMLSATQRMQSLITGLLSYSRVTTKAQPFVTVDLAKVTNEVIRDLEERIETSGGTVDVGELPKIDADPLQMRQLVQNLLSNALKFRKPGHAPYVRIHGEVSNGHDLGTREHGAEELCRIVVEDDGIGFDQQYAERIFGVFQRLHGRKEYEGSGVGLAVCRKIAERHGGTITVNSRPGEGTKFVVALPVRNSKGEKSDA